MKYGWFQEGRLVSSLTKIKQLQLTMKHCCTMKPAKSSALMRADTQQHPGGRGGEGREA